MRARSRYLYPVPGSSGVPVSHETFIDDPDSPSSRGWKPCTHLRTVVTSASPTNLVLRRDNYPDRILNQGSFGSFNGNGFFGPGPTTVPLDYAPPELPSIDLHSLAMENSRSSTNLAELISTFRDTAKMFSRPYRFFKESGIIRDYDRAGPLRNARDAINRAGSTWLEGTYGYLPLISDLIELSTICRDPSIVIDRIVSRASKPQKLYHQSVSGCSYTNDDPQPNEFNIRVNRSDEVSRLVRIEWVINPSFFSMSTANLFASYLGLNDYGRLGYELIPLSFVADWFTGIGKSISSSPYLNGPLAMSVGSVSSWSRIVTKYEHIGIAPITVEPDRSFSGSIGTLAYEIEEFNRTKRGEGDTGGSLFQNGLDGYRTATGLALLHGRAGSIAKLFPTSK